jgi:molecular chaperone DnaK (HSP70)
MEKSGAIGIDIGSSCTVIAAVKAGGIEIVLNESSDRQTPTMLSFGDMERLIGGPALQQPTKNVVAYFNRFMGLNADCVEQLKLETKFVSSQVIL